MKWFLLLLAALVALIALGALIGALLPRGHVAMRSAIYKQSPAALHALVRDFATQPAWRTGLKSVEILPPREGRFHYRETSRRGAIAYAIVEEQAPRRLVVEIADRELPFGGTWTFEFEAAGDAGASTRLRITERGEVKNVLFRFMARFVFGYTSTLETYLRDVGRKVGENITPE